MINRGSLTGLHQFITETHSVFFLTKTALAENVAQGQGETQPFLEKKKVEKLSHLGSLPAINWTAKRPTWLSGTQLCASVAQTGQLSL